ncbi:MAG: rhodanese-like domain-containing protein [Erythrobacter sp.]
MVASCTTSCASSRRNARPFRTRGAVAALPVLSLALLACAPEEDRHEHDRSGVPFGFELAAANAADGEPGSQADSHVIDWSAQQLAQRLDSEDVRLIDVRTDEEVAGGMIPGAEHIAKDDFDPASLLADTDDREIVLYCRSGRRSAAVAEELAAHVGRPVPHLAGGILAWQEAGRPLARDGG